MIISEKAIAGKNIANILAGKNVPASSIGYAHAFEFTKDNEKLLKELSK